MNRECAAVITSTGSSAVLPSSSGIRCGGNHRSHCAASPGVPGQPVRRIRAPVLGPQPRDILPEPGDRPVPADPLREHRRRHLRDTPPAAPAPAPRTARTTSAPACAHTSAAPPTPPPARPSTCRSQAHGPPAAAEPRPPPAAGSAPNPPQRSPTQSVGVASFSTVAMASFSSGADTRG